ncbi:hypothetical protein [Microbacterium amylolyticum]|uniref:Fis family transcriptional regulator n=1 Tax=Microbacterium amylolyticum TaxID=936337 RepID=A0ABS4ZJY5_9MICO|nr:hypothetical protein [Microbacterium amylolyticum]MBP2437605.1 hypothetical protein [Microbacterium amylolyticum]
MSEERWAALFEDLEHQLSAGIAEHDAEMARESERTRIASVTLRHRLRAVPAGSEVTFDLLDGEPLRGRVVATGVDWVAVESADVGAVSLIPLVSLVSVSTSEDARQASFLVTETDPLAERMTLAFVLRGIARRRIPCAVMWVGGRETSGTFIAVGADAADLVVHDLGEVPTGRSAANVRTIVISAMRRIRLPRGVRL